MTFDEHNKEPWQMTREEYKENGVDAIIAKNKHDWDKMSKDEQWLLHYNNPYETEGWIRSVSQNDNLQYHKAQVVKANAEGKPVPGNVLKEYPKLAGRSIDDI